MEAQSATHSPQQQAAGRGQPQGLASILGFVTEFNANAQIFAIAAEMLTVAIAQMQALQMIAQAHETKLTSLSGQVNRLKEEVDRLMRQGNLYRPPEEYLPQRGPR
ncbi:MAG: hypothetical protein JNL42_08080 [Anaerolineae bacterium]|nr:hypothetical protein [Anaerolineae bacterium]